LQHFSTTDILLSMISKPVDIRH